MLNVPQITAVERIGYSMDIEMRIKDPLLYSWIAVVGDNIEFKDDAPPAVVGIHNIVIEFVDKNKYFTSESHVLKTDKLKVTVTAMPPYFNAVDVTQD